MIASAQDLRGTPQGVFALFNDIQIAQANNIQLLVGETQLLELSPNVTGGNFTLTFNSVTATINIPTGFGSGDSGKLNELRGRIQTALNTALGVNATSVLVDVGASTPRFLINFRGDLLGQNAPALAGNFGGLSTGSGSASGSVTDNYIPADPNNFDAFRNSAVTFYPQGVRPSGQYNTNRPELIASAGATLGLAFPTDPGAEAPFYGIHFRAIAAGTTTFSTGPGQNRPADDILIFPTITVEPFEVDFQSLDITIVSGSNPVIDLGTLSDLSL